MFLRCYALVKAYYGNSPVCLVVVEVHWVSSTDNSKVSLNTGCSLNKSFFTRLKDKSMINILSAILPIASL